MDSHQFHPKGWRAAQSRELTMFAQPTILKRAEKKLCRRVLDFYMACQEEDN